MRWPAVLLGLLVVVASWHGGDSVAGVSTSATLDLTNQVALGNIFLTTELVALNVSVTVTVSDGNTYSNSGVSVEWNVTDYFGTLRAQGQTAALPSGTSLSQVKPFGSAAPPAGYFVLNLLVVDANHSNAVLASEFTAFAVLWPVPKPLGARYGVNEHYGQGYDQRSMQLMAKAGLGSVRDSNSWSDTETTEGTYNWASTSQTWMNKLNQTGIAPLYILAYGNSNYDYYTGGSCSASTTYPYTTTGIQGFANYATALVDHYGQNLTSIEVWNEIYTSFYCGPASVESNFSTWYFNGLKGVYQAVKAARSDVQVLGGAVASVAPPWFESLFQLGAADYMDVLSVHPYYVLPEVVETSLPALQSLISQYSPSVSKEIWATEYGWDSLGVERSRYPVASYLVRQTLVQQLYGVTRHFWYDMVDDSYQHFGLLRNTASLGSFVPNPAYVSYATLARLLNTATFKGRVNTELGPRAYVLLFHSPLFGDVRAMWTTLPYENVLYLRTSAALTLVDLQGANTTLTPTNGVVKVVLSDTPQYVIGSAQDSFGYNLYTPIADNVYDYSSNGMGHNGWYYGRFVTSKMAAAATYNQSEWQPLYINRNLWGTYWLQWAVISAATVGPAVDNSTGTPHINWAVLRYRANATIANASLAGYLVLGGQSADSDGVEARVYVDGQLKWQRTVQSADNYFFPTTFLVEGIDLVPGLFVDFVVNPGAGINTDGDSLESFITVTAPRNMSTVPAWVTDAGDNSSSAHLRSSLWSLLAFTTALLF